VNRLQKYQWGIIFFLAAVLMLSQGGQAGLDESMRALVQETGDGFLGDFMSFASRTGNTDTALFGLAVVPHRELRDDLLLALGTSQLITESVKRITGRTRPRSGHNEFRPFSGHMSFPSGHATGAFATATVISSYYPDYGKYAYLWAGIIAVSRMYEDAHWFSDVVVGSAVGHLTARKTLQLDWSWTW